MTSTTATASNGSRPIELRAAPASVLPGPISEASARLLGVFGVSAIAVVHILDAAGTYRDTRYIFWLYIAIVAGAIPIIGLLLHWPSRLAWAGSALLALGPLVGYLLSRTVGLPGDAGDIGNWLDTLGMVSLFIEVTVLGLSVTRLAMYSRARPLRDPGAKSPG